ncbi:hypothetical protein [Infirmifilum sp. NZ]|uniref:hypothetical protein n=1 Tax=Infirmifilum sp. NZ TaxID=2926850 RepID=UPI00279AEA3D|nr:hypothetical protein [Infirmifilum sp. NZ]UNQ73750.1 hypothetical protein MOV14_01745 [Infirmifilum sp. NZ]
MIRARIDEELEKRFRELAMKRFGHRRGSISKALEEAIRMWVSHVEGAEALEGDPVEAISGALADIDLDSAELQHRIKHLWTTRLLGGAPD